MGAGVTEGVAVVTPMEVVKIRLQAQQHSLADPLEAPRYRNAGHAVYKIIQEEGIATLYRGVTLTALRQATNQGQPVIYLLTDCFDRLERRCKLYDVSRAQKGRALFAT